MSDYRETTWEHIQGEKTGTMYTGETKWITKINKWKEEYPEQVDIRVINQDGSIVVHLPIKWFKVSPTKKCNVNKNLTDEQKLKITQRLQAGRRKKKN